MRMGISDVFKFYEFNFILSVNRTLSTSKSFKTQTKKFRKSIFVIFMMIIVNNLFQPRERSFKPQ